MDGGIEMPLDAGTEPDSMGLHKDRAICDKQSAKEQKRENIYPLHEIFPFRMIILRITALTQPHFMEGFFAFSLHHLHTNSSFEFMS